MSKKDKSTHQNPSTSAKTQLKLAERRLKVLEMTIGGASLRKISSYLKEEGLSNASPTTIHNDIKHILKLSREKLSLEAEEYVLIELERLDQLQLTYWTDALNTRSPSRHESGEGNTFNYEGTCEISRFT